MQRIFGLKLNDVAADLTGGAGLGKFATAATAALDGAWSAIKFAVTKGKGGETFVSHLRMFPQYV